MLYRFYLGCLFYCTIIVANDAQAQGAIQYKRDSIDLLNINEIRVLLNTPLIKPAYPVLPFNAIKVIDARFDTSMIGTYAQFINGFIPVLKNNKISIEGGLQGGFEKYLNYGVKNEFSKINNVLTCFVTRFRVIRKDTLTETEGAHTNVGQLFLKIDAFLQSGNLYVAAFRIDTAITEYVDVSNKNEALQAIKENLVLPALQVLQQQINQSDWVAIQQKDSFEEQLVLQNYLETRFNFPILKQPLKKGIYKTFEEFNPHCSYPEKNSGLSRVWLFFISVRGTTDFLRVKG